MSQPYSIRDILLSLLDDIAVTDCTSKDNDELKEHLYKNLKGKRYLIAVDDLQSIDVWNDIKMLFPDDNNGSRIILTSRLKEVADYVTCNACHQMRFLNEEESWNLFLEKVFGKEICPLNLVDVGRKIAKNCRGLPLLIVVISGLLSKENKTTGFWEYVAENISSIAAKENAQYMEILSFSYKHLPAHLKACFLYIGGVFPENYEIPVSRLVKLWVAEGFLKPHESRHVEDVAQEYLGDLVDRNLILVRRKGSIKGKVKTCIMHSLLRELCVTMAGKEEFLCVKSRYLHVFPEKETLLRRLSIHEDASFIFDKEDTTIQSISLVRSLIYTGWVNTQLRSYYYGCPLLRVLDMVGVELKRFPNEILQLVNLRYIAITCRDKIPPSIALLKNLLTLVVENPWGSAIHLPMEIFNLPQLRHLELSRVSLLPFSSFSLTNSDKSFVLEKLETLLNVKDLGKRRCFLETIPNVKKLGIIYDSAIWNAYDVRLPKLETLTILFETPTNSIFLRSITSVPTLKKITLECGRIDWEYMTIFGKLPNLEVLKLREFAVVGREWIPIEGEFLKLKFLLIRGTNLELWRADSTHFPRLEHLILQKCKKLVEIPSGFGEIQTLEIIEIDNSSPSSVKSAMDILEEQRNQGNEVFQVIFLQTKVTLLFVNLSHFRHRKKAMKVVAGLPGVESVAKVFEEKTLAVIGDVDPVEVVIELRKKIGYAVIQSVGPTIFK